MADHTKIKSTADELHANSIVVDAHHDILLDVYKMRQQGITGRINSHWGPMLRKGGVDVQFFPVYVDSEFLPEMALRLTLQMTEDFLSDLEEDDSHVVPVFSYTDIEKVLEKGKIAGILALEGAEGFGNDLAFFRTFHRLGMRVMGLTWNHRNAFADGTGEQATGGGLTKLGFAAVKEMNHLNILIDLSHINERCFFDVINTTTQPVIASHSNVKGIYDHPRNLSDEQIKALASNGGVMGLLIHPGIIDPEKPEISRCVDHLVYVSDLVGVEHIGIGTDLLEDGLSGPITEEAARQAMVSLEVLESGIRGLNRIEFLPALTVEMLSRGFSETEIRKILGENMLRVLKQVLI